MSLSSISSNTNGGALLRTLLAKRTSGIKLAAQTAPRHFSSLHPHSQPSLVSQTAAWPYHRRAAQAQAQAPRRAQLLTGKRFHSSESGSDHGDKKDEQAGERKTNNNNAKIASSFFNTQVARFKLEDKMVSQDRYAAGLAKNKDWAHKLARDQPELFPRLASGQYPEILWIGCSDSRCPETTVLGLLPGDVFVHRNIANVIHQGDINSSACIEYAVNFLKVKHIVLCGHTQCGGVSAALSNVKLGLIDTWLLPIRRLREQNLQQLQAMDPNDAAMKLAELNVTQGVKTLKENGVVVDAMEERGLVVHGVVYDVGTGTLRELEINEEDSAIESRIAAFKTVKPDPAITK